MKDTLSIRLDGIEKQLAEYKVDLQSFPDDHYSYISCVEAFNAVKEGNFGIGGVIVDCDGNIVIKGHNEMFNPFFRSDLHSEMVIMNKFEEAYKDINKGSFVLYSSLEPCPMCATRLIFSGIGTVKYVAEDDFGGMARSTSKLPPAWQQLREKDLFKQSLCSPILKKLAEEICLLNANDLYNALRSKGQF